MIAFASQHTCLSVVDQQNIQLTQNLREVRRVIGNPIVHGVTADHAHVLHLTPDAGLQRRIDIREEEVLTVLVGVRNLRLKGLKDVQIRPERLRLVHVA